VCWATSGQKVEVFVMCSVLLGVLDDYRLLRWKMEMDQQCFLSGFGKREDKEGCPFGRDTQGLCS